jgi:hypothetical protein
METVTLKGEDFRTVHNTICELRGLVEKMTHSMIKIDDVQRIIEGLETGLQDAYAQDNAAFEAKMEHYSDVQAAEGLRSIWSIFTVEELGDQHPYRDAERVVYRDHWGHSAVSEAIPGGTWIDLYIAADRCIRASGDDHHIFIEQFQVEGTDLVLQTGS